MILCQNCLGECPASATTCPHCGEPLVVRQSVRTLPVPRRGDPASTSTEAPVHPPWRPAATSPTDPGALPAGVIALRFSGGEKITLSGKRDYVIGRCDGPAGTAPDVDLGEHGGLDAGVSRRHAAIHAR